MRTSLSTSLSLSLSNFLPQVFSSSATISACFFSLKITLLAKIKIAITSITAGTANIIILKLSLPAAVIEEAVAPVVIPAIIAI